ncbi:CehA/McbA family metallohydrolase [Streptomyces sp. NPDC048514]|uniref:CehA/McbA family metallohydrolase n=1 Tax=Streptomyces sp. NPDC048514 TaxID=3365564 RepID=UPI003714AD2C
MRDLDRERLHTPLSGKAAGGAGTSRRSLLRWSALLAAGGAAALVPIDIATAATTGTPGRKVTTNYSGRVPFGYAQWYSVDFDVPAGVQRISVRYSFDPSTSPGIPGTWGNLMDIGIFGPTGFRGYSGSFRREFTLSAADATPGYIPGPIQQGKWSVATPSSAGDPGGMGWQVEITLEYGDPLPPMVPYDLLPPKIPNTGPGWYRGDLHMHSVHSDSQRTVDEYISEAIANKLDFISISDHNTSSTGVSWRGNIPQRLLVINGEEVTTPHGHWLALGIPQGEWIDFWYKPSEGKFETQVQRVRRSGGLVVAAHPMTPALGSGWEFGLGLDKVDAMEVWNGASGQGTNPWTGDDELNVIAWQAMLMAGNRMPALGNSDSHSHGDGIVGRPQNVVRADTLSAAALFDAMRRGRSYITESSQVTVDFTASANGHTVGPGETLSLGFFDAVDVAADISGAPNTVATLITEWGIMTSVKIDAGGQAQLRWRGWGKASMFARLEVRRMEPAWTVLTQMVAFTNPIWFHGSTAGNDAATSGIRPRGQAAPEVPFGTGGGGGERPLPGTTDYSAAFAAADVSIVLPHADGKTALAVGDDQALYVTRMTWNGLWDSWRRVPGPAGATDFKFQAADIAGMPDGSTRYLAIGVDGTLYHQSRGKGVTGRFSGFRPVPGTNGAPTWHATKVAAEGMPDGTLQVLTYGLDGNLHLGTRRTDGSWAGWTRLAGHDGAAAFAGPALAMTSMSDGSLQIAAIGLDGLVYHQVRDADGRFSGFTRVRGADGPGTAASSVDIAADTLHGRGAARLATVGQDGNVWYATRFPDGSWSTWQHATTATEKGFPFGRVVITPGDAGGNRFVALSTPRP